jgi:hypothetical protein
LSTRQLGPQQIIGHDAAGISLVHVWLIVQLDMWEPQIWAILSVDISTSKLANDFLG